MTAIAIWVIDSIRRQRQRRATERFLAQIIVTEFAAAHIEIAKLRVAIVPSGNPDASRIEALLADQKTRQEFAAYAGNVRVELPAAALDKADIFSEKTSNRMAWAVSNIRRLQQAAVLMSEAEGESNPGDAIEEAVTYFLSQIQTTEKAILDAYNVLRDVGTASRNFHE